MTALVAIACFLAHLRGFGLARGVLTLALAIPVIILVNAARIIISGLLQEYVGKYAILGWRHEALGFAMVLVGLALVVAITRLMAGKQEGETENTTEASSPPLPLDEPEGRSRSVPPPRPSNPRRYSLRIA